MNRLTRAFPALLVAIAVAGCSFPETERALAADPTAGQPAATASPAAVVPSSPPM